MKKLISLFFILSSITSCQTKVQPKPVADFDFTAVSGKPGSIQFTNKSTNADRYQWVFSDGQATTEESPTVTFKGNGTYSATLTAKSAGNVDEVEKSIDVTGMVTTGSIVFWTNITDNSEIEIYVDSALKGLITQSQTAAPACGAEGAATINYPAGTYSYYAKSKTRSWSGSFTVKNGECATKLIGQ